MSSRNLAAQRRCFERKQAEGQKRCTVWLPPDVDAVVRSELERGQMDGLADAISAIVRSSPEYQRFFEQAKEHGQAEA